MALFVGVLVWFIQYEKMIHAPVDDSHGFDHIQTMMWNLVEGIKNNEFRFDILLAFVSGMFWLKVLFMLRLTRTFGPMIKIIISMIKDIASFCIIWGVQLFFFTCIGVLMFGELP